MIDRIELIKGDITTMDTDVIVNAANNSLLGGGGVDGAIHRAAGSLLIEECRTLNGCPTGEAKMTGAYNLKARRVIHTVGPIYKGIRKDIELLSNCYKNSMRLLAESGLKSIAFPSVSTGVYGYPKYEAAPIAIKSVLESLERFPGIERVVFVVFSDEDYETYRKHLDKLKDKAKDKIRKC